LRRTHRVPVLCRLVIVVSFVIVHSVL